MGVQAHDQLPTVLSGQWSSGTWLMIQQTLFNTHERASHPANWELMTSLVFFVMWVVLRKLTFKGILVRMSKAMGAPDELSEYKWCVLAWNGIFHTWSTIWLLEWLPLHRWYWHTEWLWENINEPHPQEMELEMKAFYMLQLGYHFQSLFWHFVEEKRPDFVTMMVHHVVTVALIVGSYMFSYCRIGMLVLLVHDASDIPVTAVKCFHMCKWLKVSHTLFVVMVVVWFYTRLYLYPVWVIGSTWSYPLPNRFGLVWYIFVGLMSILFVLHVWWFHLFIKMALGIAKHGSGKDITETKEATEDKERNDIETGRKD